MSRLLAAVSLGCVIGFTGCSGESEEESSPAVRSTPQPSTSTGDDENPAQIGDDGGSDNSDVLIAEETTDDSAASDLNVGEIVSDDATLEEFMEGAFAGDFGEFDDFDFGFDEDQPLPPFDAVTLEEFDASWKTSLTASGEPAGELLQRLAAECGFNIDDQPELAAALETPVTFELVDVNRLQIIEEICTQAGLYPRYRLDRMKLSEGPRPLPVLFVGPFLVEARDLQEQVPYGTGSIAVQITGCTMSQDANSWLQQKSERLGISEPLATIDSVLGTGAVDIVDSNSTSIENPTASAQVVRFRMSQNLKNMLRNVEQIEQLSGTIAFTLPSEVLSHTFDDLSVGQTAEIGEMKIELTSVDLGGDSTIGFTTTGGSLDNLHVSASDADGTPVEINGHFKSDFGGTGDMQIFLTGTPATLVVRSITSTIDVAYPFELTGIPLQHAHEMPETIEPLTFTGDAPVTLTYLRTQEGDFQSEYVIEVANHSNKDLSFMEINIHYLDAQGAELDWFPHPEMGFPVVAANETTEIEVSTFFAPEGTASIRPELREVRAADATTWKLEE